MATATIDQQVRQLRAGLWYARLHSRETFAERFSRLYREAELERYREDGGRQWITIGGAQDGEKRHAGGTPVLVGRGGQIEGGPAALKGKSLDELDRDVAGTEKDRRERPPASKTEGAPPAGELPEQLRGAHALLQRWASQPGERLGPAGLPEKEGRRAWAWLSSHRDDPRVEEQIRDGKRWLVYHGADGDIALREQRAGLPTPAELRPPARPKQAGKASGKARGQQTLFAGIRPEPTPQRPTPAKQSQGELFGQEAGGTDFGRGVQTLPDGRRVGTTQLKTDQISADPARFQYKISGIGAQGVTQELKEVRKYRPEFGGQLLAWHDPSDGKTYVVNGHHRYELAKRSGYEGHLNVFLIDAKNPAEARAIGALANIAEGRGTALDAAKFLRETRRSVEDLKGEGISLKGKIAADAASLSKSSDKLFARVAGGQIAESTALAITRHLADSPAAQDVMLRRLDERAKDAKKRPLSDEAVAEAAEDLAASPSVVTEKSDLFGSYREEESLWEQRAELKRHLRSAIRENKLAFRGGSKESRAKRLSEAGNVLNVETNRQLAQEAAEDEYLFARAVRSKGPVSDAINQAAEEVYREPKRHKEIKSRLERTIADALRADSGRGFSPPGPAHAGDPPAAERGEAGGRRDPAEQLAERFARLYEERRLVERFSRLYREHVERYARPWDETKHPRGNAKNAGQFSSTRGNAAPAGGKRNDTAPAGGERNDTAPAGGERNDTTATLPEHLPSHPLVDHLVTPEQAALAAKARHHYGDEASAMAAAAQTQASFDANLAAIGPSLGARVNRPGQDLDAALRAAGPVVVLAPTKTIGSARRKIRDELEGDWSQISDLVRASVAVDRLEQIGPATEAVVRQMEAGGYTLACRPKNRFKNPVECGYRDHQLKFRAPNGLVCEIQIHTKQMLWTKEIGPGHKIYEQYREITGALKREKRKATPEEAQQMRALDIEARKLYDPIWQRHLDEAGKDGVQ